MLLLGVCVVRCACALAVVNVSLVFARVYSRVFVSVRFYSSLMLLMLLLLCVCACCVCVAFSLYMCCSC